MKTENEGKGDMIFIAERRNLKIIFWKISGTMLFKRLERVCGMPMKNHHFWQSLFGCLNYTCEIATHIQMSYE